LILEVSLIRKNVDYMHGHSNFIHLILKINSPYLSITHQWLRSVLDNLDSLSGAISSYQIEIWAMKIDMLWRENTKTKQSATSLRNQLCSLRETLYKTQLSQKKSSMKENSIRRSKLNLKWWLEIMLHLDQ
jgi:hypothetical protein